MYNKLFKMIEKNKIKTNMPPPPAKVWGSVVTGQVNHIARLPTFNRNPIISNNLFLHYRFYIFMLIKHQL